MSPKKKNSPAKKEDGAPNEQLEPVQSAPKPPKAQPTMRLWMKKNHFVAGTLKLTGESVDLPTETALRELELTRDVYSTERTA